MVTSIFSPTILILTLVETNGGQRTEENREMPEKPTLKDRRRYN
jgi:hypothetical protein